MTVKAIMRRAVGALICSALFLPITLPASAPASAAVTVTSHFIFTTTSTNVNLFFAFINNAATNGAPNAVVFVTPAYDPGGVCGCVNDPSPVGAIWASGANEWALENQDFTDMPVGASFNILVVQKPMSQVFIDTATSSNTTANGTVINSKAINGKGTALLQVSTLLLNGLGSILDPHPIGVVYGLGSQGNEWAIQNVDNATMPIGTAFAVMVGAKPSNGGKAVLLTGTSGNTFGSDTFISNSETTGNPNAVVFETQNADPALNFGSGDVAPTGVIYLASPKDVMAVENSNGSAMPTSTHYFNLLVFPS